MNEFYNDSDMMDLWFDDGEKVLLYEGGLKSL